MNNSTKRMNFLSRVGSIMALLPNKLFYVISEVEYLYLMPEESSDVFLCWAEGVCCMEVALLFTQLLVNAEYQERHWRLPFKTRLVYIFHVCVSAGCLRLKPVGSRAGASHQSKYFTFPACALCGFCARLPWSGRSLVLQKQTGSVGGSPGRESHRERDRSVVTGKKGALRWAGSVEVADEEATGSGWE